MKENMLFQYLYHTELQRTFLFRSERSIGNHTNIKGTHAFHLIDPDADRTVEIYTKVFCYLRGYGLVSVSPFHFLFLDSSSSSLNHISSLNWVPVLWYKVSNSIFVANQQEMDITVLKSIFSSAVRTHMEAIEEAARTSTSIFLYLMHWLHHYYTIEAN